MQNLSPPGPQSQHKNLVFTSAGDYSNIQQWLGESPNWDLWLCYYGDTSHSLAKQARYYTEHKGGKFPNLYYAYQHWPTIFEHYDAVFVLDDDIVISCDAINRLFTARTRHDLWLLQPSFSPRGKISHRLTKARGLRYLTYTNFVEVCTMLFRRDKFEQFMAIYDPKLVGWGVDLWCTHLFSGEQNRFAVVHDIICENPHDKFKSGDREIDKLQHQDKRIKVWEEIRKKNAIPITEIHEYQTIRQPLTPKNLLRAISIFIIRKYYRFLSKREQP